MIVHAWYGWCTSHDDQEVYEQLLTHCRSISYHQLDHHSIKKSNQTSLPCHMTQGQTSWVLTLRGQVCILFALIAFFLSIDRIDQEFEKKAMQRECKLHHSRQGTICSRLHGCCSVHLTVTVCPNQANDSLSYIPQRPESVRNPGSTAFVFYGVPSVKLFRGQK